MGFGGRGRGRGGRAVGAPCCLLLFFLLSPSLLLLCGRTGLGALRLGLPGGADAWGRAAAIEPRVGGAQATGDYYLILIQYRDVGITKVSINSVLNLNLLLNLVLQLYSYHLSSIKYWWPEAMLQI
eukprot:SAG31_NODE_597_length_13674_cov_3.402947_10_plen_126_part_00